MGWCTPAVRDVLLGYDQWVGGARAHELTEYDASEFTFRHVEPEDDQRFGPSASEQEIEDAYSRKELRHFRGPLQLELSNPSLACLVCIDVPKDGSNAGFWSHLCRGLGCDIQTGLYAEGSPSGQEQ